MLRQVQDPCPNADHWGSWAQLARLTPGGLGGCLETEAKKRGSGGGA